MNSKDKEWNALKSKYLREVQESLSVVRHPKIKQILDDVSSHLQQRFAELEYDQRTKENFQAIISEMGPAPEYAELLASEVSVVSRRPGQRFLPAIVVASVVGIAAAIVLLIVISVPAGYIVVFESAPPFEAQTAKELLDAFNGEVRFRVRTHHFRTEIRNNKLIGLICVDTKIDKNAVADILNGSDKLIFRSAKAASEKDLQRHYVLEQLSLKASVTESSIQKPPVVVSTSPVAFASDISPELKEITVTFDRPMMNLSWSWVGGGDTFPETTGQPRYDENRTTCTLPVKLQPGKFYWIGINSPRYRNFQTDMGVAAVPYVILFATADEDGKPTSIPQNFIEEAGHINLISGRHNGP